MKSLLLLCLLSTAACASKSKTEWPASGQSPLVEQTEAAAESEPEDQPPPQITDFVANTGLYEGTYTCPQGQTGMTLELYVDPKGAAMGVFKLFSIPESNYEFAGSFNVKGALQADGSFRLDADESDWLVRPDGFVTIDLEGVLDHSTGVMMGTIVQPECSTFEARRID